MIFDGSNAASVIRGLFTSLKSVFAQSFEAAPQQWQEIAMEVPSTTKSNDYAWLNAFPKMRKWVGEKLLKKLSGHTYSVVNDDFEATVEVDRNDIEDDNLGIYKVQAQMAGESAKQWPDELAFTALTQGFNDICYDGQPFYSESHPVGEGKTKKLVSNKITKKLSFATLAEAQASFGLARTMIRSMKDEEGRPLNLKPSVLVVPPALEDTANALMTVDRLEDGKPNPYKNSAKVIVDGHLKTDTEWHLQDATKPIKAILVQMRKKPVFVQQTDASSDAVFMKKQFKFGAEARGAAGYGLWQLAVGSTGTT